MAGSFELPSENVRMRLPPFLLERLGGVEPVRRVVVDLANLAFEDAMVHREYYRAFLEMGSFNNEQRVGKGMASEGEAEELQSKGSQGTGRGTKQNEAPVKDRESAKPQGTKEDEKDRSTGESSGKAGGSKKGPQENREGRDNGRSSPRNSEGTTPKKTKVSDARRKLAEIEKRTAEYKARLMKEMMAGNERDSLGEGSREERRISQGEIRHGGKDNNRKGTPSKKGKEKGDAPAVEAEKATTSPAMDSGTSRLPATPKIAKGCDGFWSLRERALGWFDLEDTTKAGEKQGDSKEGEGTSPAGEAGSSEGGLKKIVATLTRALNKNQGYLADAKKKLNFDGANITEFLTDYENLTALLKWSEEEKMDHLGQHVSLSLGRDIMTIVATSGSWKETRNEMMRKYLKAEKMATEAELAAVQRKNYATYNDFLRAFTLVALRIPGVTDRIMSKYFLRQFSKFDKDKLLSAYQQTSKFEHTRDVDFNTVTDLAEKTVVTDTLALLKEGEVIDLTGKTGDKVKKGIESLHERVHEVDSKIERVKNALLVMQAQVSRPALPPQEAEVPAAVANRGYGRRDPANEQCKYCTMVEYFVRTCPRLNHDIIRQRCSRSLKGEIIGPQGERVNWNSLGGMRRVVIILNNLDIAAVEAEPVADIVWDQPRGRGPQTNFILEGHGQDRVNITTRRAGAEKKLIRDVVMEEVAGTSADQDEAETGEQEKVYGKTREEEPIDKAVAAKKKFRYQILILTSPEIDDTLSKLLGTMETEEAEAPQGVSNLQRVPGDLEDLEKAFADIRLSLPDREGGEVMRAPPGTKLSFHALPVGKLKVQIGTHHTDALVDSRAEITLIRRDFAAITGCTVNKEVTGSIRGAGGEIPFAGYVTKCAVRAGIRESIWSFQRMTVMEEMNHDIIFGRPWCANVEMIGMHLHDDTYMVDIEDPVTGRGELLRLLGTGGDPPKGKLATWSPTFEESARRGAFARMEGMRERVKIMIEEAFSKKEWIKMGLPLKKRRQEDEVLGVMVAEKEAEVEFGASLPKTKKDRKEASEVRAFLGVVGFWRIFIKGFAKIAEPIRAMIREGGTMEWTEDREATVQTLKDILTSDQVTLAAPCFNDEVGRPFILEMDGGPLAVGGVLIQRSEEGKERPIRFESRTLNLAERRYSQFKKEVLAILHCLKTFQAYLFGRRFILRIDPTNVAGALKNYKPINLTVGRWIGFIWQFDYKVERIAGLRNRAAGLSRVCITPEEVEDEEPIDAFLEYEGGTLVVDNEMADTAPTMDQFLIQTLEKGAPAVAAELREGPVTTIRRKDEKDSWGAPIGPKEELMAMVVEGGRDVVMNLVETWTRRERQYLVNQAQEEQDTDQKGR
ncbi:hypothetical protein CBR_g81556 [Chara braunii]|uniref:Reverse transcriptase/retrotransposon-derived protein RNase H-like domain-containing protein n=1 Tax=Chara braunii TaxID=69332 RepID=A0A388KAP7_CHABU|nr:hypothetical protein CBR_g81556 [Chara braunii]|eukprot:GBG67132.1 hypothetical protein CBR_g81556 [Chara braunii]